MTLLSPARHKEGIGGDEDVVGGGVGFGNMKVRLRGAQPIVRKLVLVTVENISELVSTPSVH